MEELQNKHRREQIDLQGRITQKKKNATKKTRKGVNGECEGLQTELHDRQRVELDALSIHLEGDDAHSLHNDVEEEDEAQSLQLNGITPSKPAQFSSSPDLLFNPQNSTKKPNRQKARLARRAAEQEAQAEQAAEEAAKLPDLRQKEVASMQEHFEKLGFKEVSVRPDGHCMYSAVAMLLRDAVAGQCKFEIGDLLPYKAVRVETARFISEHPDDFEPFLEESIEQYTYKIKNTTEWGGQLELQAIARAYGVEINVLQGDGRIEKIESGMQSKAEPLWLTYYRHSFGLGEHYNALKRKS